MGIHPNGGKEFVGIPMSRWKLSDAPSCSPHDMESPMQDTALEQEGTRLREGARGLQNSTENISMADTGNLTSFPGT